MREIRFAPLVEYKGGWSIEFASIVIQNKSSQDLQSQQNGHFYESNHNSIKLVIRTISVHSSGKHPEFIINNKICFIISINSISSLQVKHHFVCNPKCWNKFERLEVQQET